MNESLVKTQYQDQIAIISLNRPDKRNAMTPEMLDELCEALANVSNDIKNECRAIAFIGTGKTFCAGFDLKMCAKDPSGETMRSLLSGLSQAVRMMRDLPIPVVLGVHGAAVAGGCALLGGADIVIADQNAKLGYPVVKIGVSPAVSAAFMMSSITPGAVRNRLVDTDLINGTQAMNIGLVHETVDSVEGVRNRTIERANQLASKPGIACRATKEWLNEITSSMTDHAQAGLNTSLSLTGSLEEQERLAALWG